MIKIIVDSTAYTPKEYAEANDITVIPLRVLYKDKEFDEGFPGTYDEFFEDFTKTKIFPKTSQPSLEAFTEEYNKAIKNETKFWSSQSAAHFLALTAWQVLQKSSAMTQAKSMLLTLWQTLKQFWAMLWKRSTCAVLEQLVKKLSQK